MGPKRGRLPSAGTVGGVAAGRLGETDGVTRSTTSSPPAEPLPPAAEPLSSLEKKATTIAAPSPRGESGGDGQEGMPRRITAPKEGAEFTSSSEE